MDESFTSEDVNSEWMDAMTYKSLDLTTICLVGYVVHVPRYQDDMQSHNLRTE
jgi:hypothetical protein